MNGIRYAHILKLAWPIYVEAAGWLGIGVMSSIGLGVAIHTLGTTGLPETYKGIAARAWTGLGVWLAFAVINGVGKYISVRNAKRMSVELRIARAETENELRRFKSIHKEPADV